jgi:large subunit ribosomal protein L19e
LNLPDLYLQKRLAADIANVGINNVKIPEENLDEIKDALTRSDIKKLIEDGKIVIEKKHGISNSRVKTRRKNRRIKGEGRRQGSKNGKKGARIEPRSMWINKIRKIREYIKWLRDNGIIDKHTYRLYYRKAKGGTFKSLSDVRNSLKQSGKIKE